MSFVSLNNVFAQAANTSAQQVKSHAATIRGEARRCAAHCDIGASKIAAEPRSVSVVGMLRQGLDDDGAI